MDNIALAISGYSREEVLGNNYRFIFDENSSKELLKICWDQ